MALDPQQQADFDKALHFVLQWEGDYSNDPTDHGGATNFGIIQREYDRWRDAHNQPRQSVISLTSAEVSAIYVQNYWLPVHTGLMHWPASLALFDSTVNTGLSQGMKFLQRALNITDDGVCGPNTQAEMSHPANDWEAIRDHVCDQREAFYRQIAQHPGQSVFLRGWLNRVVALRAVK